MALRMALDVLVSEAMRTKEFNILDNEPCQRLRKLNDPKLKD